MTWYAYDAGRQLEGLFNKVIGIRSLICLSFDVLTLNFHNINNMGGILFSPDNNRNFFFFKFNRSIKNSLWLHLNPDSNCKLGYYAEAVDGIGCQLKRIFNKLIQIGLKLLGGLNIFLKWLGFLKFHVFLV